MRQTQAVFSFDPFLKYTPKIDVLTLISDSYSNSQYTIPGSGLPAEETGFPFAKTKRLPAGLLNDRASSRKLQ